MENKNKIWDFLKSKGLNDFAVAGIMGNLYAESGLNPINLENYYEKQWGMSDEEYTKAVDDGSYKNFVVDAAGYGLAQWTYFTRKQGLLDYAKAQGVSIGNLEMQLEYLWSELQNYSEMMNILENATNVFDASTAVLLHFERPADQSFYVKQTRAEYGQKYYDEFAYINEIAPNGKAYEQNDIDYLLNQGYTKKAAIEFLSTDEKYKKPVLKAGMLSEHFAESEFTCHCCGKGADKIDPRLIDLLEQLRANIGGYPLTINSGYRCPAHNAEVGGVSNSQHVLGTAADVARPKELSLGEFEWYVNQLPFDGIGLYPGEKGDFIHVDVRDGGIGSKIEW